VLEFDTLPIDEDKAIDEITEQPALANQEDLLMPTMVEYEKEAPVVEIHSKITVEKNGEKPEYFEISSAADQISVIEFDLNPEPIPLKTAPVSDQNTPVIQSVNKKEASTALSSGGYLAKPKRLYAEEEPKPESNLTEEPLPLQIVLQEDEPVEEMQLVVKDSHEAAEEQKMHQTQPIMMSNVEEPAPQDEAEEQRRRAMERIAKLRNLSFNINAADPNNEFESVPAYLRRNMELHNSIAQVETFYSNYTVKTDENNKTEISTINTFLEGKKPD
jgi:cell division protein FtsZ